MRSMHTAFKRLYQADTTHLVDDMGGADLLSADGRVRALVLELARPADWSLLAPLWRGVQVDLELPAPAIAVSGVDGHQLWFSLEHAVPVAQAQAFLQGLRLRYLADLPTQRVRIYPCADARMPQGVAHAALVPLQRVETGHWSAFVAPDLAAIFSDEPWLDMQPSPEAQAKVLSGMVSTPAAAFAAALATLVPAAESAPLPALGQDARAGAAAELAAPATQGSSDGPRQFLRALMQDSSAPLALRLDAAKALLPYCED